MMSDGNSVAGNGYPVHSPSLPGVVVNRVLLRAPVVPHCQGVDFPLDP